MAQRRARAANVLLALQIVGFAAAWRTQGTLQPYEGTHFSYVGKFCFDNVQHRSGTIIGPSLPVTTGSLEVELRGDVSSSGSWQPKELAEVKDLSSLPSFPAAPGGLYLAIFSDAEEQWQTIRRQWGKLHPEDVLNRAAAVRAVTPMMPAGKFSANVHVHQVKRPRFLYFVFVFWETVKSEDSVPVTYKIHATNVRAGFEAEFSVDEFGRTRLHLLGLLAFVGMITTVYLTSVKQFGGGALLSRPLLRLLLISCACSAVNCLCKLAHDVKYSLDGVGSGLFLVLGELFAIAARILLTTLQLYVANGKALIVSREQRSKRHVLSALVLGIVVVSLGCEVYARYFGDLDWSLTPYFYASWPGLLLLALNTAVFVEVCRSTLALYVTPDCSRDVQRFYAYSFAAAALYFATLPAICVLAKLLNPWDRRRLVTQTELGVRFLATLLLLFILRPSRLDPMINARMETTERREQAVEMANRIIQ